MTNKINGIYRFFLHFGGKNDMCHDLYGSIIINWIEVQETAIKDRKM
jgi:hypothetical protein